MSRRRDLVILLAGLLIFLTLALLPTCMSATNEDTQELSR